MKKERNQMSDTDPAETTGQGADPERDGTKQSTRGGKLGERKKAEGPPRDGAKQSTRGGGPRDAARAPVPMRDGTPQSTRGASPKK